MHHVQWVVRWDMAQDDSSLSYPVLSSVGHRYNTCVAGSGRSFDSYVAVYEVKWEHKTSLGFIFLSELSWHKTASLLILTTLTSVLGEKRTK